jgi:hypothetical protein
MPCMGPDLKSARQLGNEVGKVLLEQLIDHHSMWDISEEDKTKVQFFLPGAEKRWKRAKAKFIKAVEELFVEDACNGF